MSGEATSRVSEAVQLFHDGCGCSQAVLVAFAADRDLPREQYEKLIGKVDKLKTALKPGDEMVKAAIRYVISHPAAPVAIPGAKSPAQAVANAAAGDALMPENERAKLAAFMEA
jgi:aryl-alcohol dehydrogenase-like predicted oxidoreductase